jgi:hypothetical protein
VKRLAAGLLTVGLLALAACGDDESSDARDAAVDWAERVDAGDAAACRVMTERGGLQLAGNAGGLDCEDYTAGTEFLADAFLLDSTADLVDGLVDAGSSEAVDARGESVQRLSFEPSDGVMVEVDLLEDDGRWLVNDYRAISDPLAGPGSEAIDEAALDGLDQADPDAVRVRWAELMAAKDPSACLLFDPAAIYSMIARAPNVDSCAELVTSGLELSDQPGAELVEAAKVAGFAGAPRDSSDPNLELRRYSAQFDDGGRYRFDLVLDDGAWRVQSLSGGQVEVIVGGKKYGGE